MRGSEVWHRWLVWGWLMSELARGCLMDVSMVVVGKPTRQQLVIRAVVVGGAANLDVSGLGRVL